MSKINDGGPAFPVPMVRYDDGNFFNVTDTGMSLRDWFAGQALAGIMANSRLITVLTESKQDPTSCAYQMADFMLAERAKSDGN